ncbi:MAG: PIN domain-containing protein [Oculatellaceae cyanobacterium Prado106]|jgi:predicted nucleic acid-binding protein|nr:PIN domain-containing protein [Oculatellaceae cyanobacterium Prado106]
MDEALQGVSRVFLDTAPVIYYVEARAEFVPVVRPIFHMLDSGLLEGIASPVTLAECLVQPKRLGLVDLEQGFSNLLTNSEGIVFVEIGEQVGRLAAQMRSQYALRLPDALQIATAIATNCQAFLTNDTQLTRITELRVLVVGDLEASESDEHS